MNGWGLAVSFLYIFAVIFAARPLAALGQEISRKFIHVMVSNWWLIAMWCFTSVQWAVIVPLCFTAVNWFSRRKNIFPGMERQDDCSYGTVFYALALVILTVLCFGVWKRPELGLLGVFPLGYGDGFAAVIGKRFPIGAYSLKTICGISIQNGHPRVLWGQAHKTLSGSFTMFLVTLISVLLVGTVRAIPGLTWPAALLMALAATAVEAVGGNGLDNLLVPLVPMLFCQMMLL